METQTNQQQPPRSVAIARRGVKNTQDFAEMMSALMSDIIEKRIPPDMANAAVKAGQQMLKVIEMQIKHGKGDKGGSKPLELIAPTGTIPSLTDESEDDEESDDDEDEEPLSKAIPIPGSNEFRVLSDSRIVAPDKPKASEYERRRKAMQGLSSSERSVDSEFRKWCRDNGYGEIRMDDPRRANLIDSFYDWKDAERERLSAERSKNAPEPQSADFEHESGLWARPDEADAGDVPDFESIMQDAHS